MVLVCFATFFEAGIRVASKISEDDLKPSRSNNGTNIGPEFSKFSEGKETVTLAFGDVIIRVVISSLKFANE